MSRCVALVTGGTRGIGLGIARALARGELPYATGTVATVDGGLTIPRL